MKGKEKAVWDLEDVDEGESAERWWKVWDVRADCREIGGMECYGMLSPFPSCEDELMSRWIPLSINRTVCLLSSHLVVR